MPRSSTRLEDIASAAEIISGKPAVVCYEENTYANIVYEKKEQTAVMTLNRPKVLNALNDRTIDELAEVFGDAATDESIRVVVLTGSGDKAFAAGADIGELVKCDAVTGAALSSKGQKVFRSIETMGNSLTHSS